MKTEQLVDAWNEFRHRPRNARLFVGVTCDGYPFDDRLRIAFAESDEANSGVTE